MRQIKKYWTWIAALLFVTSVALAANISDNTLNVGDRNAGTDKEIQMGDGRLKWDSATSKMVFSNDSGASQKEIGSGAGGGAGGITLFDGDDNADFEGVALAPWVASAGAFVINTGTPGFGLQSGSWDSSAASQTLDSALKTTVAGLENRSCNATIQYKYDTGSSGDLKFQVIDSVSSVIAEKDLALTTDWEKAALQFTCPAGDSLRIRITSVASDPGILLIDDATLGKTDFVQLSQAELVADAHYEATTNCTWSVGTGLFTDFPADPDCPPITVVSSTLPVDTTDNDLPDIDFDFLPPGTYHIEALIPVAYDSLLVHTKQFKISDGTTPDTGGCADQYQSTTNANSAKTIICKATFTYTAGGARNFKIQAADSAAGSSLIINTIQALELRFTVWRVPSASAEAITLETTGWKIEAMVDLNPGGNIDLGTTADGGFNQITDSTMELTDYGTKGISVALACDGAEASSGTSCTTGNVGIAFNNPFQSDVYMCVGYNWRGTANSLVQLLKLVRTSDTSNTALEDDHFTNEQFISGTAQAGATSGMICGMYENLPVGLHNFKIIERTNTATSVTLNALRGSQQVTNDGVRFIAFPVSENFPTPVFTDLNDSLSKRASSEEAGVRVCGFGTNQTGAGALESDYGNCILSYANAGSGQATFNFNANAFPGAGIVTCTCTVRNNGLAVDQGCITGNSSPTKVDIFTFDTSAGTATNSAADVVCIAK